jgi:branched-chain amino acid transport system substrate-binding protein
MITPSATNPKLTQNGYENIYRLMANDNALGAGLATYAVSTLHLKSVAVIDDRTAYGQGVAEVFKKTAQAKGIKVVGDQYTNDRATDFMSILTAIKARKPEGVFYGGMDPQAGPMLRQMEQLGMANVKYFGGDGICTTKLPELSSGAKTIAGVVCAEGGAQIAKMPGGPDWKKRYDAKYPGEFQIYSPFVYDATMVLADAMVRAKSADPKVYAKELPKTNYQGVTGKIVFEKSGELKDPAITLYKYVDGKKEALN